MALAGLLICVLFILLIAEAMVIRRSVARISVRIHVNGTRGKSSITTYIAAALRASGIQVQGKVTGEIPALILADGTKKTIRRTGPARIQEQFRTIHRAARSGAEALVLECMSIAPELQETESRYFKPHIYVLSNIRDDHREKMGTTREEQVASMCRAIPKGCVLVTNDMENLETIRIAAKKKKCRMVVPHPLNCEGLGMDRWKDLPTGVFLDNISLAMEAAIQAGMNRDKALDAILKKIWDRKAEASGTGHEEGKAGDESMVPFLNAFSVNDPSSATVFLYRWRIKPGLGNRLVLIFNTRSDRPLRTDMFSEWIRERKEQLAGVFITGDHRARAYARLKILKPSVEVCKVSPREITGLSRRINQSYGDLSMVVGIGNIKGDGFRVLKEFER